MDYRTAEKLVEKYLNGTSTISEEKQLAAYFQQTENIPAQWISIAAMFGGFSQTKKAKYKAKKSGKRTWMYAAASLVMVLGICSLFAIKFSSPELVVEQNVNSEPLKVSITKHQHVWLKQGAEVSYVKGRKKGFSIISVSGEAYFDFSQTKEPNLQVLAHNAIIKIEKPTAFNVQMSTSSNNINITVKSGAVKVQAGSSNESLTLLVPENNYCSVHKTEHLVFSSVNTNPNYLSWLTGELVFDNQNIATITDMLAQYYQVEFKFEDMQVAACTFSGTFQHESIEYILKQIQHSTHCKISEQDGVFSISGTSCKNL